MRPDSWGSDWRLPENRREAFIRSYHWRRWSGDLDHTHGAKVICEELNYDDDQKAWFSLLFGHTYRNAQAMIYVKHFPDPTKLSVKETQKWTDSNWMRLVYGKDCRWQIGKFPKICEGVRNWLAGERIGKRFRKIASHTSQEKNFYVVLKEIQSLPFFGRMTTWLAMQALYDTMNLPINHFDLLLGEDAWSPYNGLCCLLNCEHLGKTKNYKPTQIDIVAANKSVVELVEEMQARLPYKEIDVFRLETHLCEYRKWNSSPPKEYLGWTTVEMNTLYLLYHSRWPEENLQPFLKGLMTEAASLRAMGYSKNLFTLYGKTGMLLDLNELYPDMPDVYKVLGWDKRKLLLPQLFEDYKSNNKEKCPSDYESFKPGRKAGEIMV